MADPLLFVDPSGKVVELEDGTSLQDAQAYGYSPASVEQVKKHQLQKQYGEGIGNELKAFGEAAADTASFGLYNQAAVKSGFSTPEAIKARAEFNPASHFLGQATGVIAPMALGDEAGALNLPGAVANMGKAAETAVAKALPEATSLGAKVLKGAVIRGVGSSIEGMAYGAGQLVSEQALGDTDFTAQAVLSHVGLGAALGGSLGVAEGFFKPVFDAGKDKIAEYLVGGGNINEALSEAAQKQSAKALGLTKGQAKKIGGEEFKNVGKIAMEEGVVTPWASPEEMLENAQGLKRRFWEAMQYIYKKIDETGARVFNPLDVAVKVDEQLGKLYRNEPLLASHAAKLEKAVDTILKRGDENISLMDAQELKNKFSEAITDAGFGTEAQKVIERARGIINGEIDSAVEKAATQIQEPGLLQSLQQAKDKYGASKVMIKGLEGRVANNVYRNGSLTDFVLGGGLLTGHLATLPALAALAVKKLLLDRPENIAHLLQATADKVSTLAALERTQNEVLGRINTFAKKAVSEGDTVVVKDGMADGRNTFKSQVQHITKLMENPEMLHQTLVQQTALLQNHAPDTAQSMQMSSANAINYLSSQIPKSSNAAPQAPKFEPSQMQIANFMQKSKMVKDPVTQLGKHLTNGTLTPDLLEAAQVVAPKVVERYQKVITNELGQKTIPFRRLGSINILLGQNVTGMSPRAFATNQAILAGTPSPQAKGGMPTSKGLQSINVSNRMLTPMQMSNNRR